MNLQQKHAAIVDLVRTQSPYDNQKTDALIQKYFKTIPNYVRFAYSKYNLGQKKVLDIGSSYGPSLLYWGEQSDAFDVSGASNEFLHALGKKVHIGNVEDAWPETIAPQSYDAVFSNNLYEHLVAPHLFLAKIHTALKDDGMFALGHPAVPMQPVRMLFRLMGIRGWLACEHINFFTPQTTKLALERAGFIVEEQIFTGLSRVPLLAKTCLPAAEHVTSFCRKDPHFKYPKKRHVDFDPTWAPELTTFH